MATRTAPTVNGTPTEKALTLRWIDHSGDQRATRLILPAGATDVQIEAVADTAQAISNASLWQVKVEQLYTGAKLASNAVNQTYPSVFDNVVLLAKESTLVTQQAYIVAPQGVIIPSGDNVDVANLDYIAWRDAVLAALAGTYAAQSVRFTERREKNDSTPAV